MQTFQETSSTLLLLQLRRSLRFSVSLHLVAFDAYVPGDHPPDGIVDDLLLRGRQVFHLSKRLGDGFVFAAGTVARLARNAGQGAGAGVVFEAGRFAKPCRMALQALGVLLVLVRQSFKRLGMPRLLPGSLNCSNMAGYAPLGQPVGSEIVHPK